MPLLPRWRFMTDEAKAMTKRVAAMQKLPCGDVALELFAAITSGRLIQIRRLRDRDMSQPTLLAGLSVYAWKVDMLPISSKPFRQIYRSQLLAGLVPKYLSQ